MQSTSPRPTSIEGKQAIDVLKLMLVLGLIGILVYGLALEYRVRDDAYAIENTVISPFGQILSVGLAVGGATLMIGGFLGFLFGIPRTFQNTPDGKIVETEVRANTNLEQISDWLTKILVGVGLTQISEIPARLNELSAALQASMGNAPGSAIVGIGIVFYFLVCGFLIGFLWTRLYLPGAFREADKVAQLDQQVASLLRQPELNARARTLVDLHLDPRSDAKPPTQQELDEAVAAASSDVRAEIGERARQKRKEGWHLQEPDKSRVLNTVIPVFEALVKSDNENKDFLWRAQLAFALKDKENPDYARAEKLLTEAIERRGSPNDTGFLWYEINRALCIILQDNNFKQGKPSDNQTKERIRPDLAASLREWENADPPVTVLEEWLDLNGLTANNFRS